MAFDLLSLFASCAARGSLLQSLAFSRNESWSGRVLSQNQASSARISIHNGDNAVLKKIEDPRYVPQDAQDEMRVARALSVSFGCAAAGKNGQMF